MRIIINYLSLSIASYLKRKNTETDATVEEIQYGFSLILNYFFVIFLTTTIGLMLGNSIIDISVTMIAFVLLRRYSGGLHLSTSESCIVVSTIILTAIPMININDEIINVMDVLSVIIIIILAPVTYKIKKSWKNKYYVKYKFIALALVLINSTLINSNIVSVTFFVQTITILLTLIKIEKR